MRQIGRYEIIRELGRGAMGVVWEARDPLIRRTVAIKTIERQNLEASGGSNAEDLLEKVLREARAAGVLSHPHIVVVHDVGQGDDFAYIAMEHVDGPTLRETIADGMDLTKVIPVLRQTGQALDYAHSRGIVHRDIKPGNIMLHLGTTVKITDFGVAKVIDSQSTTQSGLLQGTPSYMAPESFQNVPVDGRLDQFSLAVTAFEMFTGERPFQGESLMSLMHSILTADPPRVSELRPALPEQLDVVLAKALAKSSEDRYRTCLEFVDKLDEALAAIPGADQQHTSRTARPGLLRAAAIVGVGVLLLVLGIVGDNFLPLLRDSNSVATPAESSTPVPIDIQFDVTPAGVVAGQAATLRWNVKGASEVRIDGIGAVSDTGQRAVFPERTTLYLLTANSGSQRKTASVEVIVSKRGGGTASTTNKAPQTSEASASTAATVDTPQSPPPGPGARASAPQPPVVPTNGSIVWTGRLAPGAELTITRASASTGTVSSTLPEAPVNIEAVFPSTAKVVRNESGELVLKNTGNLTETTLTIRWTSRK